jgi:cyclopropane fatty-acyl-phospholipid synthase-like methyltransferase
MTMDELQLLVDLHKDNKRQGPGGDAETRLAVALSGLKGQANLKIADIGCGTGASTLVLADELDAHITAVDFLPEFLSILERDAAQVGVAERITTLAESMDALPFKAESLDAIWSEGAIYNMGFEAGVAAWRQFLKPGGILAVSELTWLTAERPAALQAHWDAEYPQVDTASAKMAILEQHGFKPMGYFFLSESCWLDNYYRPIQQRLSAFLDAHGQSDEAKAIVAAEQAEIALYEQYRQYVSYGYYVAQKLAD